MYYGVHKTCEVFSKLGLQIYEDCVNGHAFGRNSRAAGFVRCRTKRTAAELRLRTLLGCLQTKENHHETEGYDGRHRP
jgi:hypothetical protein